MNTIELKNTSVPYKISKSTRAKHIGLRISQDGHVTIVIPKWARPHQGLKFAEQKSDWILKHIKKIQHRPTQPLQNDSTLTLFGEEQIVLKILTTKKKRSTHTLIESDIPFTLSQLQVEIPLDHPTPKQEIKKQIETFYRETARTHLAARTTHFASLLNLRFNQIRLKDTRSRWGSCSRQKNLNYNYRIILAPKPIIDYLVIHEVCHLRHLNHSQKFWNLVESLMPDYPTHRKWLRENGNRLKLPS